MATETNATHEDVIWNIASWMSTTINEHDLKNFQFNEIPVIAETILVDNLHDNRLQGLLLKLGDNFEARVAGMGQALTYTARAFAKYSSVYPGGWLEKYKLYVTSADIGHVEAVRGERRTARNLQEVAA